MVSNWLASLRENGHPRFYGPYRMMRPITLGKFLMGFKKFFPLGIDRQTLRHAMIFVFFMMFILACFASAANKSKVLTSPKRKEYCEPLLEISIHLQKRRHRRDWRDRSLTWILGIELPFPKQKLQANGLTWVKFMTAPLWLVKNDSVNRNLPKNLWTIPSLPQKK